MSKGTSSLGPSRASLPARPDLEWYRKSARKKLKQLRARDPKSKLADAQLAVAREHGFASWRKLRAAIETTNSDGQSIFAAAERGDLDTLRRLLDRDPKLVRATDERGLTPLHYAASDRNPGRRDLIAALLSSGADVGARDCAAFTPLHFAAGGDDVEVARMLLDAGAEVDAKDVDGDTPLIVATRRSSAAEPMIALLREHGADPLLVNTKGWSALLLARRDVIGGNTEQVKRAFADLPDPPPRIQPPPPAPVSSVRDALNRLRDEGIRNGNLNWEVGNYAALAEHVRANLDDPTLFDEVELRQLRTDFAHLADPEWLGTFGPSHDWGDQEFGRLLAATERWEATRSAR